MNVGFVGLGLVMSSGALLLHQEFTERERRERRASFWGFLCLGLGGLGVILVGVRPENTVRILHLTGAGLAIGIGNLGILLAGLAVRLPVRLRGYSIFFSLVSLVALLLFAFQRYFGLGAGGSPAAGRVSGDHLDDPVRNLRLARPLLKRVTARVAAIAT